MYFSNVVLIFIILFFPLSSFSEGIKIAVLDLKVADSAKAKIDKDTAYNFADQIRIRATKSGEKFFVMTKENIIDLLAAQNLKLEDCEGQCEVETGRKIGADYIISGEIISIGKKLKLTLKLHNTGNGKNKCWVVLTLVHRMKEAIL